MTIWRSEVREDLHRTEEGRGSSFLVHGVGEKGTGLVLRGILIKREVITGFKRKTMGHN
jgi:hypothetical protein